MARPTMDDVAAAAEVSRSLVSLVFQDSPKVSESSRARVLRAADELGYRPNALARSLASTRTQTLGILLDDLHNPYFADILDALQDAAEAAGYRVLLADGRRDGVRELDAIRTFIDHRVDGVILASPRTSEAELGDLARLAPIVSIERRVSVPRVDVVMHDARVGARLIVEHLTTLGHRTITHVDGGPGAGSASRRDGYLEAMEAAGLSAEVDVIAGEFTEVAGRAAAELLLQRNILPTAIFCANDYSAAGVAAVLGRESIPIPGQISLVGYDDTTLAQLDLLSLTSIRQPLAEMAAASIELVNRRIETPDAGAEVIEIAPLLVPRRSTATARAISAAASAT
jgi:DNA-binding LacI/PurR family transcriptional regulator